MNPDKSKDVVCYCSGATKQQIKALINNGADNLDEISRMTGACSGCGSCDVLVLELLAENVSHCQ
jgi:bacterioferritin-associated ferredoxin